MKIDYAKSFLKDIKRIKDLKVRARLETTLCSLESADNLEDMFGIVAMSGNSDYFRIRIGQYRLGLKRATDGRIKVLRFLTRGEIYRYFP